MKQMSFALEVILATSLLLSTGLLSCSSDKSGSSEDSWAPPEIHVQQNGSDIKGLSQLKEALASSSLLRFQNADGEQDRGLAGIQVDAECDLQTEKRLTQTTRFEGRTEIRVEEFLPRSLFARPLPSSNLCRLTFHATNILGSQVDYRSISVPVHLLEPLQVLATDPVAGKVLRTPHLQKVHETEPKNTRLACTNFDLDLSSESLASRAQEPIHTCRLVRQIDGQFQFSGLFRWSTQNPDVNAEILIGQIDHLYLPVIHLKNPGPLPVRFSIPALQSGKILRRQISAGASQEQEMSFGINAENVQRTGDGPTGPIFQILAQTEAYLRLVPHDYPCKLTGDIYGYQFGLKSDSTFQLMLSSSPDSWSEAFSRDFTEMEEIRRSSTQFPSKVFWLVWPNDAIRNIPWAQTPGGARACAN